MIYILSEGMQKGKTMALRLWSENRIDVGGFLTPDKDNKRILLNIHSCVESPFEMDPNDDHEFCVHIGKFVLDTDAFIEISEEVLEQSFDPDFSYIVIDEIGKLELQDKGFHPLMDHLSKRDDLTADLIIIVRDTLLDDVIKKYEFKDYKVISKHELHKLV